MLYQHQIDGLNRLKNYNRCAFYWDMGLGKTFVGAEKMLQLGSSVNLLICQKSKIKDWVNHFVQHYVLSENLMIYDVTKWKKDDWQMFSNDPNFINNYHKAKKYVLIINYELCWRRPELAKLTNFTLMLDESSCIQHISAKQTKFIVNKLKPLNVILLSGTPCAGKYEDLWTQAKLLGWDISKPTYEKHYINYKTLWIGNVPRKIVDKDNPYKNVERLKNKLREHGADFLKTEDVLDLPEQNFIPVMVPESKEYRKFIKTGYLKLEDGTELIGDTTFNKRLRSRQLCGMYSQDKLNAFRDLLQSTNDRLIVFYNFTEELRKLTLLCGNRPISIINGETKDLTAYDNCSDSVTFVQYQAGAMGLNLQKANKIIYFTLPERSDLFEQSKKRIHRIGQNNPCFYYIMMCEGSVEEVIYETLKLRKDFTDELFEEKVVRK